MSREPDKAIGCGVSGAPCTSAALSAQVLAPAAHSRAAEEAGRSTNGSHFCTFLFGRPCCGEAEAESRLQGVQDTQSIRAVGAVLTSLQTRHDPAHLPPRAPLLPSFPRELGLILSSPSLLQQISPQLLEAKEGFLKKGRSETQLLPICPF